LRPGDARERRVAGGEASGIDGADRDIAARLNDGGREAESRQIGTSA
jgi:hypothetical protein